MVSRPPPSSSSLDAVLPCVEIKGIPGSPGVAVGPALVVGDVHTSFARRYVHTANIDSEIARVKTAVASAQASLREVSGRLSGAGANDQKPILDAYLLMLADPLLHEEIDKRIRE